MNPSPPLDPTVEPNVDPALHQAAELARRSEFAAAKALLVAAGQAGSPLARALDGALASTAGRFQEALAEVVPLLPALESGPWARQLDWLYSSMGFALGMLGDAEHGLRWVARALRLCAGQEPAERQRLAQSTRGVLLAMLEQWDEARQALLHALDLAQRHQLTRGEVVARVNLAYTALQQVWTLIDAHDRAAERLTLAAQAAGDAQAAQALAQRAGFTALEGLAWNCQGYAALLGPSAAAGPAEAAQAQACFEAAEPLTQANPLHAAETRLGLAMVARLQGDWAAARRLLPLADERARSAHLPHVRGHVLDEGVRLEMAAGDALRALHWARQGTEHWKQQLARRAEWLTRSAQLFDELETSRGEAVGLRQRAQVLEDEALHDPLTGALNRRGLDAAWRARPNGQLALLMLDADHFKRVNDRFGHPLGDAVLRVLVERIRGMARQGDAMVRWGGEEFLLLLPGANELGARLLGERLREAVQGHAWHGLAAGLQVTISLGLATWDGQEPLSELIARADAALYEAKQQGRNRLVVAGTRPA